MKYGLGIKQLPESNEGVFFIFSYTEMGNEVKYTIRLIVFTGLMAIAATAALAHAEKAFYLKGKLGEKEIALKMLCYDETPAIRFVQYFFSNDKRDRHMAGKLLNGYWRFAADVPEINNYPKPEGVLNIAPNGANWQGSWTDNGGKEQAILLTPIADDFMPPQFCQLPLMKDIDPYEKYRLATLHFEKKASQQFVSSLEVVWYFEKESGISFFRLGPGSSGVKTGIVNTALEAIHLSLVQQHFAYSPQKKVGSVTARIPFLNNELVSFRTFSTSRFLNLTNTQPQLSATLDIATGESLKLEDLIWLDKETAKPAASDFFALYQYRKKVFAPRIFQWLQELYPQQMKANQCGTNKAESWNLPAWNLTNKGLLVSPTSMDECGTFKWAVIPYEKLQPFIAKKYHLPTGR